MMADSRKAGILPPGQPYIQTSTLQSLLALVQLLTDVQRYTAMMGVAVGAPGIGKSVSLLYYEELLARKEAPAVGISIRVYSRPTPHFVITRLFEALGEAIPAGQYSSKLDGLAAAIRRHDLHLVILDEADKLNDPCLDLLCSLFDMTGCPCLLVGLPTLFQRCQKHSQLWSRVGVCLKFSPLSFEEVLHQVLPALDFPGWEFDPAREADRLLAGQLWEEASPSLRRLCTILGTASTLAHMQDESRITSASIQHALQLLSPPLDHTHERTAERRQKDGKIRFKPLGPHERHSQERPELISQWER
jgi:type II secretory pathway predicted ATPase ExeA